MPTVIPTTLAQEPFAANTNNIDSAHSIADYFVELDGSYATSEGITETKLNHLLYYAYGFYLALEQRPLFPESIEAGQHAPVIRYEQPAPTLASALDAKKKDFLAAIYREYGQYATWKLTAMLHKEAGSDEATNPWQEARAEQRNTILPESMAAFFQHIVALNESDAIATYHPEVLERLQETQDEELIPLEDVIAEFGIAS